MYISAGGAFITLRPGARTGGLKYNRATGTRIFYSYRRLIKSWPQRA